MQGAQRKSEINRLIETGEIDKAFAAVQEFWREEPGSATASFIAGRIAKLRSSVRIPPHKLAILRSFTVEPLVQPLRAAAFVSGIELETHLGEFNAYAQEMLDPGSALYRFVPDTVILAVQTRDCVPDLWSTYSDLSEQQVEQRAQEAAARLRDCVTAFRSHSQANLIVHTLEAPETASAGILDAQKPQGQLAAIARINEELRRLPLEYPGVYVLDYDALVARYGRTPWHDERKWLTVRLPVSAAHHTYLVREWLRYLHPLTGKITKAVVIDLDNTLWGGVIGEDGIESIQIGAEYPGAAYRSLQRALLDLRRRGILLAIASKNNPAEAMEVLEKHPGMLLRPEHFAAIRMNWADKASNLREIAEELNIGIDSLAFLDDNPVERQHIRAELPQVTVVELPADPMEYARAVRESPYFERLTVSAEDRQRGDYYAAERRRAELQKGTASREDFFRSLEQVAEIAPVTPLTLARVAQLTQKTNQFNLTTRRYTEQQIAALQPSAGWDVFSIQVQDRFADNGIVGVAIACAKGDVYEIDTLLLSCRVIGRTIETALMSHLVDRARAAGARKLQGWFVPTKKNAPAKEFYSAHGFQPVAEDGGGTLWEIDLAQAAVECPEWIQLKVPVGEVG